jgi:galactokinase
LRDAGVPFHGLKGEVIGEVPVGAGLSSSAALEVALALAVVDEEVARVRLAEICRDAENRYVGIASGIMDQLTSAAAQSGHACLIDCRDNSIEQIPMPPGLRVLIIDSGIARALNASPYNERVEQCSAAANALGVRSLRDSTLVDVQRLEGLLQARARHIVTENTRTHLAAQALRSGNTDALGSIFEEAHASYARDFQASTPEIDRLVSIAAATDGVVASRLTGGGWGGCTANLVAPGGDAEAIGHDILERYERETGRKGRWWVTGAAAGAERLR